MDIQLIQELNLLYGDEDPARLQEGKKTPFFWKASAAVTFLIFTFFILGNWLKVFTWLSSATWDKQGTTVEAEEILPLKEPVVHIEAWGMDGAPDVKSRGTGFNIDPRGLIVTNKHIVEGARGIEVGFPGQGTYQAVEWYTSAKTDLALVKLKAKPFPQHP